MNILHFLSLLPYTLATILQKRALDDGWSKVIHEEDAPSLLACVQLCTWRKSDVHFKNGLCKCLIKGVGEIGQQNKNFRDAKQGVIYQQIGMTGKSKYYEYCSLTVLGITSRGKYFWFKKGKLNKLEKRKDGYLIHLKNVRSGIQGLASVWVHDQDPLFDGSGRFGNSKNGHFRVGDELIVLDKQYCTEEITY